MLTANHDAKFHLNKSFFSTHMPFRNIDLVQIGRLHCNPSTVVDTHVHLNWYELTVVTDGEGTVTTDGVATTVRRGDIYLSYPCDAHKIESHPARPLCYDFFAFFPRDAALSAALEQVVELRPGADLRVFRDERVSYLINCAIAEFCTDREIDRELLEAIFYQIHTYLVRNVATLTPMSEISHKTPAEALCFRVMNHIDTHLYALRDLRDLAALTGYHYSYLSTLFRKTTGNTLSHYYQNKKLTAARLLLREGRLSVSQIADLLGYSTVYAFSKAYRNRFGMSPREDGAACGRGEVAF